MTFPVRGYPLGALFVLVTVCAVLVAGVTPLVRMTQEGHIETFQFLVATAAGALGGIVIGVILGLMQFRMGLGVVMGTGIGAILGTAAGLMSLLTSQQILTAALAMTAGSGLIVIVAVVMRRNE
jgi:uncharacterized membrane protein